MERTHQRGLLTGAHIILGLPGEDAAESLRQAPILSQLPIDILKIHQMQIIRGTKLAEMYEREPIHIYSVDEYIELIAQYIQRLRPDMVEAASELMYKNGMLRRKVTMEELLP